MHKSTNLGLGLELRYILGKVLGTQDHPALRLAFICITFWINLTKTFIKETLYHASNIYQSK